MDTHFGPLEAIHYEARVAAKKFADVNEACPYPFDTEAGRIFREAFNAARGAAKPEETGQ